MVRSDVRHPAPHKDWAQLNSRRKAQGATAGLVAPSSAAARHPLGHDALHARRRARADTSSAGRSPGAIDLALRRATGRGGRLRCRRSCRCGHIAASGADVGERRMPRSVEQRRFPPPWSIDEANSACFIVRDNTGQALGYFYFEDETGRRSAAKLLTHDEARRQLAQVPDLTRRSDSGAEARQQSLDIAAQGRRSPLKSKTSAP